MRNIETFPSKQMYPYLSLVERKVAEFYHNIDRRRYLVWFKWLIFIVFPGQFMVSLCLAVDENYMGLMGWDLLWVRNIFDKPMNSLNYCYSSHEFYSKHCQSQNGPEGWVHITRSQFTNLEHITISESRLSINFKISTKHQHLD